MKLRVSLRRQGPDANVVITADGTATVGDVAVAIASAGEDKLVQHDGGLTLRLLGAGGPSGQVIHPSAPLVESGVQQGSTVEVVPAAGIVSDDRAAAEVKIVAGPDKGVSVQLRRGTSTIGRDASRDVRLTDPKVSKNHGRIIVGDRVEIVDDNSSNGILVGEQRVTRAILGPGDIAVLGETHLTVTPSDLPGRGSSPTAEIAFVRSPCVMTRPVERELELPEAPRLPNSAEFPWAALIAPLAMGVGMYVMTRSMLSLIFVALSPILMLGTYVATLVGARRTRREEEAQFREALDAVDDELAREQERELEQRRILYPSVSECVDAAFGRTNRLWSRRPEHPEFLRVRLGAGPVLPLTRFGEVSANGRTDLVALARERVSQRSVLADAPVFADLAAAGGVGVVGPAGLREGVARALVAQIAALHSPAEVTIACLTSTASKGQWAWLEWLPHTSAHSPLGGVQLGAEAGSGRLVLDRIEELVADRLAADSRRHGVERGPELDEELRIEPVLPGVLLVVDEPSVDWARLVTLAEQGPDVGVHVLWVAERQVLLPAACRTFVDLGNGSSTDVGMVRSERTAHHVSTESVDVSTAIAFARNLAPVVDAGIPDSDESDLPRVVSVVSLLGVEEADDETQVLARWKENGSYVDRSAPPQHKDRASDLRALVGHAGAEPFSLDLRTQGPHALVGGTTGSGKSEFLQAWVLGLAHAYSPDRVSFLFVDYKGGAAFAKCVDLPHTVGMVTDLSPYLVQRALRSLRAEIHHREKLLSAKGMKDLIDLEKSGDPDCPPSLLIIVDEFAALIGEVPEFIEGVVDVAQRGRSLGLHLILATQRPAGVIKDNLRANTNLRVALRVNDEHDSSDVLGDKLAAHFDPSIPGRGAAKTGPARIATFQSAFPGARTTSEPQVAPVQVAEFDFGVVTDWKIPTPPRGDTDIPKDIDRVVSTVARAARLGGVPAPRKPWLDALAPAYDLAKLNQRRDYQLVLGMLDDPDAQEQQPEHYFPDDDGNILYFGTSGSGKSTALRSLGVAASITPASGPVHVYGLDFAGGALRSLQVLPNVADVVPGDDDERVQRLIRHLIQQIDERSGRFTDVRASSLTEFRRQANAPDEPRLLLLLDGFGAFRSEYETPADRAPSYARFLRILSEGRQVGVHVAMSADNPVGVPAGVAASFGRRVVLRQADSDAYAAAGVRNDVLTQDSPPGRAIQPGQPKELQIAVLGEAGLLRSSRPRSRNLRWRCRSGRPPGPSPSSRCPLRSRQRRCRAISRAHQSWVFSMRLCNRRVSVPKGRSLSQGHPIPARRGHCNGWRTLSDRPALMSCSCILG